MLINEIKIQNFRALAKVELSSLDPNLNIFLGVNGAGKSSVLDALWLLLRKFQFTVMDKKSKITIHEDDVTQGQRHTSLVLAASFEDQPTRWSVERGSGFDKVEKQETEDSFKQLVENWKNSWKLPPPPALDPLPTSYPLLIHYPVTRAVLDIPLRVRNPGSQSAWRAWAVDELGKDTSFRAFFAWFRNQEDLENERRLKEGDAYRDSQLNAVRQAVEQLLPGYKNLHIQRLPLRMMIEKLRCEFSIQQLSDGEKCLLALIGDLARRLALANPSSDNPLEGKGVILIDELDMHLHPRWQIEIIPKLLKTFPNCQFFISTHSPLLVSHARSNQIFLLEQSDISTDALGETQPSLGIQAARPNLNTYGQDINLVVSNFMGTAVREIGTDQRLKNIFETLADPKKWQKAQDLINTSKEQNPDIPELMKAQAIFDRKSLLKQ